MFESFRPPLAVESLVGRDPRRLAHEFQTAIGGRKHAQDLLDCGCYGMFQTAIGGRKNADLSSSDTVKISFRPPLAVESGSHLFSFRAGGTFQTAIGGRKRDS